MKQEVHSLPINKFKTSMLRSSLYDYGDAYILVKRNITVNDTGTDAALSNRNKKVIVLHLLTA